jgi:hypothetical protein
VIYKDYKGNRKNNGPNVSATHFTAKLPLSSVLSSILIADLGEMGKKIGAGKEVGTGKAI